MIPLPVIPLPLMPLLAQVAPPPFSFNAWTWGAFFLANAIIMAILGKRLLRDLRGWFTRPDKQG